MADRVDVDGEWTRGRADGAAPTMVLGRAAFGVRAWLPLTTIAATTVLGWGLVTNFAADWLSWQAYLLGPLGLGGTTGRWAGANLGVLLALLLGFLTTFVLHRSRIRTQETTPPTFTRVG
jgi:NCS1 family nucleobase:cation symporter-1